MDKRKKKKIIGITTVAMGATFVGLTYFAKKQKPNSIFENDPNQKNPLEGKRVIFVEDEKDKENADGIKGHLVEIGDSLYRPSFYEKYIKRGMDVLLSFGGLVVLSPIMGTIALAIKLEDPGPVLFTQKRLGQNKQYFKLHKFRSMRMSTPHDVPTHMLDNPDQYITKVGKFIRAHSLDELPQIWDIFIGNMSVIGPRPGLWNQDLLTAERDKYSANDVKPGLTGWAQINGRDELEIPDKAKLDGEYVKHLGPKMDTKIFLDSLHVFSKDESVVEGGTGEMKKTSVGRHYTDEKSKEDLIGPIGFGQPVEVDTTQHKKILITGKGSYIGETFKEYANHHYPDNFEIDTLDMLDPTWKETDFSNYDVVYHVAGIAHADVGNVSDETKEKYYKVNTDLAIEVCQKAKQNHIKEFIFMSSMIVYGDSAPYGQEKIIDKDTVPNPANFYGDSKLQADVAVRELADDDFKVLVLRPPMIYGKGSKGNYPTLAKLAKKLPIFPDVENQRSMLYIENLCEFLCQVMLVKTINRNSIVLFPQNKEYTKTADMVKEIANASNHSIFESKLFNPAVVLGNKVPGNVSGLVNKAFGNNCYDKALSQYEGIEYQKVNLEESIVRTEGNPKKTEKKHILVVSQYFFPEQFRINDICQEWVKRGYKVTVVTGIPNYPMGHIFEGYGLTKKRHEIWNDIEIYRIPLIPRGSSSFGMIMNYVSFMVSGMFAGHFKNIQADLVFSFEVSPMTQVLTGISFAKRLGIPHYLYVQDLWPENVETVTGIQNSMIINPINKMVDYIYKNSDEIFTTSPSFVDSICNRKISVDRNKVHFWPQYAEDFYQPCVKKAVREIRNDDSFKIIFTGNIGTAQGLDILPKTIELLKDENIKVVMVGDGRYLEKFNQEVRDHEVADKFIMVGRQPAERIPELLSACDVAFLSFQDKPLWEKTIPAKLQSYMACGMPIIAAAKGETERIIAEANCGMCCAIGNSEELSKTIRKMMISNLKSMSIKSREYFEEHFDKQMLMNQMESYFNSSFGGNK